MPVLRLAAPQRLGRGVEGDGRPLSRRAREHEAQGSARARERGEARDQECETYCAPQLVRQSFDTARAAHHVHRLAAKHEETLVVVVEHARGKVGADRPGLGRAVGDLGNADAIRRVDDEHHVFLGRGERLHAMSKPMPLPICTTPLRSAMVMHGIATKLGLMFMPIL